MHHTSWILLPLLLLVSVSCSTPDAGHERLTRQQLSSWVPWSVGGRAWNIISSWRATSGHSRRLLAPPAPLTGPSCQVTGCGARCARKCAPGTLCAADADCQTGACLVYPRAFRGKGRDERRCGCPDGQFVNVEHPSWGNASRPCVSQAEMCTNGKWDAFEGAADCGFFCQRKCRAGQTCRGHGACATRHCDAATKTCGCPAPLRPSAAGTSCERILSTQVVTPANCSKGVGECRCPQGATPLPDGASCLLEQRESAALPLLEPDPCFNDVRDEDESDWNCGGPTCTRRCGSGQLCRSSSDCAMQRSCGNFTLNLKQAAAAASSSAGGAGAVAANSTQQGKERRCLCPQGRFIMLRPPDGAPACVTVQELCSNAEHDATYESDLDCGGACAKLNNKTCTLGKQCKLGLDCESGECAATYRCTCPAGRYPAGPFCTSTAPLPPVQPPAAPPPQALPPGIAPGVINAPVVVIGPPPAGNGSVPGATAPGATPPGVTAPPVVTLPPAAISPGVNPPGVNPPGVNPPVTPVG